MCHEVMIRSWSSYCTVSECERVSKIFFHINVSLRLITLASGYDDRSDQSGAVTSRRFHNSGRRPGVKYLQKNSSSM